MSTPTPPDRPPDPRAPRPTPGGDPQAPGATPGTPPAAPGSSNSPGQPPPRVPTAEQPTVPLGAEPAVAVEAPAPLVVEDFRSLRRWLVLLGLLAAAALIVAIFAVLRAGETERESAEKSRVATLEAATDRRLDEVERRQRIASEEADVRRLEQRQRADTARIDQRLRTLQNDIRQATERAGDATNGIRGIERRIDALEQQARRARR